MVTVCIKLTINGGMRQVLEENYRKDDLELVNLKSRMSSK